MSITQTDISPEQPVDVIVRCFGGRPARLRAVRRLKTVVEVYRENPNLSLGWPDRDVYRNDDSVFAGLETAWKSGDAANVAKAWKAAEPFVNR